MLLRNLAVHSGDDGIDVRAPGTTVTRNIANDNHNLGISAVPGVIDGGGNQAAGNGDPGVCGLSRVEADVVRAQLECFTAGQAVEDEPPRGSPPPHHAMAASDPGQVDRPFGLVREQDHLTLLATWQGFVVAPVTGQLDCTGRHGGAGPLNSDPRAL